MYAASAVTGADFGLKLFFAVSVITLSLSSSSSSPDTRPDNTSSSLQGLINFVAPHFTELLLVLSLAQRYIAPAAVFPVPLPSDAHTPPAISCLEALCCCTKMSRSVTTSLVLRGERGAAVVVVVVLRDEVGSSSDERRDFGFFVIPCNAALRMNSSLVKSTAVEVEAVAGAAALPPILVLFLGLGRYLLKWKL